MNDPTLTAIKHRRKQHLDMDVIGDEHPEHALDHAKLHGQPGPDEPNGHEKKHTDKEQGDLAPDSEDDSEVGEEIKNDPSSEDHAHVAKHGDKGSFLRSPARNNVMHKLQDGLAGHEAMNPEHHPVARGNGMSELGHEQMGQDSEFEEMMNAGHEHDAPGKSPKTLGARVRLALQSKKGKH